MTNDEKGGQLRVFWRVSHRKREEIPVLVPTLVPKLRLGTLFRETPFPESRRASGQRPVPRNGVSRTCVPKRSLGTRRRGEGGEEIPLSLLHSRFLAWFNTRQVRMTPDASRLCVSPVQCNLLTR
jgi:hypothetical protein